MQEKFPFWFMVREAVDCVGALCVKLLTPVLVFIGGARDYWRQQQR